MCAAPSAAISALRDYPKELERAHRTGQAGEHGYRTALQNLLRGLGGRGVDALNEPLRVECGAPDFLVSRDGVPVGYIECKDINVDLRREESSEQLQRYRSALPNLILTDYLEFRWYVEGELCRQVRLGEFDGSGAYRKEIGGEAGFATLLEDFFAATSLTVSNPADLARLMAGKARILRQTIRKILEDNDETHMLNGLLKSYREVLISDLDADAFADMQAQTTAYGLFAARCIHKGPVEFTKESAAYTQTTPFLKDLFNRFAGPSGVKEAEWIVDDLARLLASTDMEAVLSGFGRGEQQKDPLIHFYEDFLRAYDPDLREMRGVYYTPEPVVSFIVRSVDHILRRDFDLRDGLSDTATVQTASADGDVNSPRVLILDPAAGTGTFLREVISVVRQTIAAKGLRGAWPDYVGKHLLPRLFGFELLMAPYAICHLNLALEIGTEERFSLPDGQRLGIYLTNALEEPDPDKAPPLFADEIAREVRDANAIKAQHPVMVVVGNPPYSGHSANKGQWIGDLLRGRIDGDRESYFTVDGNPLDEKNPKWLNDDYVKFIRFAQWRISQTGEGVLGFVSNHSYLDNPTFRGMRQSLMDTFDEIRILDLHGNAKKREQTPDGGQDDNVFDIQQGVAIALFVKYADGGNNPARVFHADLWGLRTSEDGGGKYGWLSNNDISTTQWAELAPITPDYLFAPRDQTLSAEYDAYWKVTDIMSEYSVGIVTARDKLAIQWTQNDMREVAEHFTTVSVEEARNRYQLGKDSSDWKVADAQQDIRDHPDNKQRIAPIQYRPFDQRYTYYTGRSGGIICRPRLQVMHHMLTEENLGLSVGRAGQVTGSEIWDVVLASKGLMDFNLFRRGGNCLFPLYLYSPKVDALDFGDTERIPNLDKMFTGALAETTGLSFVGDGKGELTAFFGPEDVFYYLYAILHSPDYRRRYADFLNSDFPRIPLPTNQAMFVDLANLGADLTALHLLEATVSHGPDFPVEGSGRVERVTYQQPSEDSPGRVFINDSQRFDSVAPEVWGFTIGGYRPVEKWLKDRKHRTLDFDDIRHYQRICGILAETLQIMERIDKTIETHGGWPFTQGKSV